MTRDEAVKAIYDATFEREYPVMEEEASQILDALGFDQMQERICYLQSITLQTKHELAKELDQARADVLEFRSLLLSAHVDGEEQQWADFLLEDTEHYEQYREGS